MNKLITTNIKLVREILTKFSHPVEVSASNSKKYPSFWEVEKMAVSGGPKKGSSEHDKYIY